MLRFLRWAFRVYASASRDNTENHVLFVNVELFAVHVIIIMSSCGEDNVVDDLEKATKETNKW